MANQDYQQQIASLQEENQELKQQLDGPDLRVFEQNRNLKIENQQLSGELEKLTSECVQQAFRIKELETQVEEKSQLHQSQEIEFTKVRQTQEQALQNLEEAQQKLQNKLAQAKELHQSQELEIQNLKEVHQSKELELQSLKEVHQDKEEEILGLKEERENKALEVEELKANYQGKEQEILGLKEERVQIEKNYKGLILSKQQELDQLQTRFDEFKERLLSDEFTVPSTLKAESVATEEQTTAPEGPQVTSPYNLLTEKLQNFLGYPGKALVDRIYKKVYAPTDTDDPGKLEEVFDALAETASSLVSSDEQRSQLDQILRDSWSQSGLGDAPLSAPKQKAITPAPLEAEPEQTQATSQEEDTPLQVPPTTEDSHESSQEESLEESHEEESSDSFEAVSGEESSEETVIPPPITEQGSSEENPIQTPPPAAEESLSPESPEAPQETISLQEAPATEEPPATEALPVAEEPPATEEPPVAEEPPATEELPATEEPPSTEALPVAEEPPATEALPATEELPVAEEPPATEALPVAEESPATEEPPVTEESPVAEEPPATEELPVAEEPPATEPSLNEDGLPVVLPKAVSSQEPSEPVQEKEEESIDLSSPFIKSLEQKPSIEEKEESAPPAVPLSAPQPSKIQEAPPVVSLEEQAPTIHPDIEDGLEQMYAFMESGDWLSAFEDALELKSAELNHKEEQFSDDFQEILRQGMEFFQKDSMKKRCLIYFADLLYPQEEGLQALTLASEIPIRVQEDPVLSYYHIAEYTGRDGIDLSPYLFDVMHSLPDKIEIFHFMNDEFKKSEVLEPISNSIYSLVHDNKETAQENEWDSGFETLYPTQAMVQQLLQSEENNMVEVILDHIVPRAGLTFNLPSPSISEILRNSKPSSFSNNLRDALKNVDYTIFFDQIEVYEYNGPQDFVVLSTPAPRNCLIFNSRYTDFSVEELKALTYQELVRLYTRTSLLDQVSEVLTDSDRLEMIKACVDIHKESDFAIPQSVEKQLVEMESLHPDSKRHFLRLLQDLYEETAGDSFLDLANFIYNDELQHRWLNPVGDFFSAKVNGITTMSYALAHRYLIAHPERFKKLQESGFQELYTKENSKRYRRLRLRLQRLWLNAMRSFFYSED